jgi:polyisoprenyl-phosphate glycosyltransferase
VLPETSSRMTAVLQRLIADGKISTDSQIYFVDDGSRDSTWQCIKQLARENGHISGIKLSRNRGHQNALIAGLFHAEGDALISIDADLQDDINAISAMVDKFVAGSEVVYGVRKRRDTDRAFKRVTAIAFYRLLSALGAESLPNHADYRLMSRRAIECLKQFREINLYLRGMIPLIGFGSDIVYYERVSRFAGESKYPLNKMIGLALDAITSFSVVPLRLIALAGFAVFFVSMLVTIWVLWAKFFTDQTVPGWASIVLPMYFLGGIQIFCLGVIGEYLGKLYSEIKSRPRFFIEEAVSGSSTANDPSLAKTIVTSIA